MVGLRLSGFSSLLRGNCTAGECDCRAAVGVMSRIGIENERCGVDEGSEV